MSSPFLLAPLLADAGVPMILLTFPAMVILLVPIILVEAFLCKKWLGLTTWQSMKANTLSNLASTIIGVPLAWALLLGVEFGVAELADLSPALQNWNSPIATVIFLLFDSAWIGPPEHHLWIVPAAVLILLVPFFFASYGTEYLVLRFMVGVPEGGPPNLAYRRVRVAVRNANLVTYGAMFIGTSVWLVISLWRR